MGVIDEGGPNSRWRKEESLGQEKEFTSRRSYEGRITLRELRGQRVTKFRALRGIKTLHCGTKCP